MHEYGSVHRLALRFSFRVATSKTAGTRASGCNRSNEGEQLDLPPGLRQPVKTHLAVCRKSIVRRLVAATELRSWTTADSGSLCRVFAGSSRQCLTSCTSSV